MPQKMTNILILITKNTRHYFSKFGNMTQADPIQIFSNGDQISIKVKRRHIKKTRTYQAAHQSGDNSQNPHGTWSGIKIAHTNINSIRYKLDQLYTEFFSYDIICVSETKLNQNILNQDLELHGFHLPIRKDREENNGGGLLIYIKRNVHFERRQDLESNEIENIWAEVTCHQKKFLLGLFYRPPESPSEYWNLFENNIDIATDTNMDMLIMGDFNHDMLKFNPNSKLLRILTKYNIQNMINEPTRITQKSQTCIDLILTNHSSIIINTEVLPPFCSDHCSITAEVNFKTYKAQAYKQTIWKYNNANKIALNEKLIATDWSFINNSNDIDYINEKFNNTLLAAANDCIPKVTFTRRPSDKPWVNNEIRSQMRQRNRLFYKAKNSQSEDHFRKFKDKRNQVTTLIREAKKQLLPKTSNITCRP